MTFPIPPIGLHFLHAQRDTASAQTLSRHASRLGAAEDGPRPGQQCANPARKHRTTRRASRKPIQATNLRGFLAGRFGQLVVRGLSGFAVRV